MQTPPNAPCPPATTCESITLCCTTIQCSTPIAQCNAFPTCDPNDTQVDGGECPQDVGCYTRSLCGSTILCIDDGCDPDSEYNRKYIAMGPECGLIDYTCTAPTEPFGNECGCGCEQDADCPQTVDCSPGPEPRPECSDELLARCPYTLRAL